MNRPTFDEGVAQCLRQDPRYPREAYSFVRDALDFTIRRQMESGERRQVGHVSGQQLSEGARDHALDQFGPLARIVLDAWGIRSTDDIGAIVFNLIGVSVFSKSETDDPADFHAVFEFEEAFDEPFRPMPTRA